jgi:hypothetical protein
MYKRNVLGLLIGITLFFGNNIFGMRKGLPQDQPYTFCNVNSVVVVDNNLFPEYNCYNGILTIKGDEYSIRARVPGTNKTIKEIHWQHMPIGQDLLTVMKNKPKAFYLYAIERFPDERDVDATLHPKCGIKIVRVKQVGDGHPVSNRLEDAIPKNKVQVVEPIVQETSYRKYAIFAVGAGVIFWLLHRFNVFGN